MTGVLKKLFENSKIAINDGVYEINQDLERSNQDFIKTIL